MKIWTNHQHYQQSFMSNLKPSGHVVGTGRCKLLLPTPQIMADESTSYHTTYKIKQNMWGKKKTLTSEYWYLKQCKWAFSYCFAGMKLWQRTLVHYVQTLSWLFWTLHLKNHFCFPWLVKFQSNFSSLSTSKISCQLPLKQLQWTPY